MDDMERDFAVAFDTWLKTVANGRLVQQTVLDTQLTNVENFAPRRKRDHVIREEEEVET